ncbi:hypothetical protein G6L37_07215 [Agrobacterium rubi]|nr:hypothetical protein [Agrobacterium rubi]NTF25156.1 hypothetical protein [Agrobacterium rubi]
MTSFVKMPIVTCVASLLSVAFMVGWMYHASFHLPLAIGCLWVIVIQNRAWGDSDFPTLTLSIPVFSAMFAILSSGSPTYAQQARISASVEACVVAKGTIKPCLEEAKTLYGFDVSAYSLSPSIDWRAAMVGCLHVSGARACVEDFANNDVASIGVVSTDDVAAICADATDRTDCLLDLSSKGYPFKVIDVFREAAVATEPTDGALVK